VIDDAIVLGRRQELLRERRAITVGWEHRRRTIERALHDGLQQQLLALRIDLIRGVRLNDAAARNVLRGDALVRVDSVTAELYRLASGSQPSVLDVGDLAEALRELATQAAIPVHVNAPTGIATTDGPTAEIIVYVVSEALANAQRYAMATQFWIEVSATDVELIATVRDNGSGGAAIVPGRGLDGLRTRADALGGTLTIESSSSGTTLTVSLPFRASVQHEHPSPESGLANDVQWATSHGEPELVQAFGHLRAEQRKLTTLVGVFEASLRARLTSVPGNELMRARAALVRGSDHEDFLDSAEHVEAANERLREIVRHLRSGPSESLNSALLDLSPIAQREDVGLSIRVDDDLSDPGLCHCVERVLEELIIDADRGSQISGNIRLRDGLALISVSLSRLPGPLTTAFVDELVYAARGHWLARPGEVGVRFRLELPCES
jgi:two-component sensor histidine kinase